jgi:hypothetical protein
MRPISAIDTSRDMASTAQPSEYSGFGRDEIGSRSSPWLVTEAVLPSPETPRSRSAVRDGFEAFAGMGASTATIGGAEHE